MRHGDRMPRICVCMLRPGRHDDRPKKISVCPFKSWMCEHNNRLEEYQVHSCMSNSISIQASQSNDFSFSILLCSIRCFFLLQSIYIQLIFLGFAGKKSVWGTAASQLANKCQSFRKYNEVQTDQISGN